MEPHYTSWDKPFVAFSGKAGAGKDAAAEYLAHRHNFCRVAMADEVKRVAQRLFDFTYEQLWGPSELRNKPDPRYPRPNGDGFVTPREVLQKLGTDFARTVDPDVWVRKALEYSKDLLFPEKYRVYTYTPMDGIIDRDEGVGPEVIHGVVITDCRFKNEVLAIRKAGGKLIRVKRPGSELTGEAGQHLSETELDTVKDSEFDAVIVNSGTLNDYVKIVDSTVRLLCPKED